jgi:hypothetical protein
MQKIALLLTLAFSLHSFPIKMFYQGILTDSAGKPIQVTDSIRVQLHESNTSTTPLWQETHLVTTKNGAFSILLGQSTPLPLKPFIDNDSLYFEFHQKTRQKTSRTKIGINAFSIRSIFADSSAKSSFAKNADTATFGSTEFSIISTGSPILTLKEKLGDTTVCRARFTAGSNGTLTLDLSNAAGTVEAKSLLSIKAGGDVLSVAGGITASSYKASGVTLNVPDYVFHSNYELSPLSHVESYIRKHNHLPEIPSAKEINGSGMDVVDMNLRLLKKIEEITLHLINQEKKIAELELKLLSKELNEGGSP